MTDLQSVTLMMASAQVIETSVNTNNSPSQDYTTNPDDHSNHNIDSPGFKPFTVIHKLLLTKLQRFGITGNVLRWLNDFLSERKQRVTLLGETSQALPVLSGVPQGSILGSLLLLIYVNDLPASVSTKPTTAIVADDTKCYCAVKTTEDGAELQRDLTNLMLV